MSFEATLEALLRRIVREELAGVARPTLERELLTIEQACELFTISKSTLTRWIASGLPSTGKGKMRRVRADDLKEFMNAGATAAPLRPAATPKATVTSILASIPRE